LIPNSNQRSVSFAYAFWIIALLFGFPLLSSFYAVQQFPNAFVSVLVPYIAVSALGGLLILKFGVGSGRARNLAMVGGDSPYLGDAGDRSAGSGPQIATVLSLMLGTIGVASFGIMKYFLAMSYPRPSDFANVAGLVYMLAITGAVAIGVPLVLLRLFPIFRRALSSGKSYKVIAIVSGCAYILTYFLLVNQILITGFNTPPDNIVGSPTGTYPFTAVFTAGPAPSAALESFVYVPFILVQLNLYFNFIIQPFEIIFGIVLANLIAASIVSARYLINQSSGHSCATGAAFSGIGGIVGLTATCPSCLAPTIISVIFGGFSATSAVARYSTTLTGVIGPPLVSILALLLSLVLLEYKAKGGQVSKAIDSIFGGSWLRRRGGGSSSKIQIKTDSNKPESLGC
jgi:hypothetical protein